MRRMKLMVVTLLVTAVMLAGASVPASAQGYTGWIENPYPSAGLWYCDWYGSEYWCQDEWGNWFRANPNWYNQNSAEMLRVYGQPVL
jgi:hypothetical protein